jgi:integrase
MNAIELSSPAPSAALQSLAAQAVKYVKASRANSTRKAYASDLADFKNFCAEHKLPYLPTTPETVALYVTHLAALVAVSTIKRRLAAINDAHRREGFEPPATPKDSYLLGRVLAGVTRTLGVAQHGAEPILGHAILRIVAASPHSILGNRDRALIRLGFATGSRRSELVSMLKVEDLTFTEHGLLLKLTQAKNDQEKAGRTIAIVHGESPDTCPVLAVRVWIERAGLTSGPLFRSVSRHGRISEQALSTRAVSMILIGPFP